MEMLKLGLGLLSMEKRRIFNVLNFDVQRDTITPIKDVYNDTMFRCHSIFEA